MNAHTHIARQADNTQDGATPLTGLRIADPASFLSRMSEGAKFAPTLEEAVASGVKACGPEFGEFLARRYGGRVAAAVAGVGQ